MIFTFIYTFVIIRDLHRRDTSQNNLFREAKIHFGFLVLGFKREWWWWTYVRWIRKILILSLIAEMLLSHSQALINKTFLFMILLTALNWYAQ